MCHSGGIKKAILMGIVGAILSLPVPARAADKASTAPIAPPTTARTDADKDKERNFYEVLEDIVNDFEYDMKNGEVTGLKDIAIRNVAFSENIPPSFKNHLELLITEKILKTTRTRVLQCLPCKAHKSVLNGDQVVITSAESNPQELARIAKQAGIEHFMDIAFSYQPAGIVMSMYLSEPDTGTIVWSRSYNSETSRAAAFRRGVDYSQTDDARKQTEYQPALQHRLTIYYLFVPNIVPAYSGTLQLAYRLMERYDNRKKEVGFEMGYSIDPSTLFSTPTSGSSLWTLGFNLSLLFMHTWNFIGEEENFNKIRFSLTPAIGGVYASGYLSGQILLQGEFRFARHWGIHGTIGYRPPATAFTPLTTPTGQSVTGVVGGAGISFLIN